MAKFNAATAVDPIEIDWSAYGGPVGTIPEPSTDQITQFQNALLGAAKSLGLTPGQAPDLDDIAGFDEEKLQALSDGMEAAMLEVCGGFIKKEDYARLPFRVKAAFNAWLAGELRPEAPTPGMKR